MGIRVEYTPPAGDMLAMVAAACELGVESAGKRLLDASLPLVPVGPDTKGHKGGTLKASGKSEPDGPRTVKVSYQAIAPDGYAYGIRQHEDLTLNHPGGGEAKFLEKPMHSEAAAMLEAMAEPLRAIL